MKRDIDLQLNRAFKKTFPHAYGLEIMQGDNPLFKIHQNAYETGQSHLIYSVTKSVLALLMGIAVDQGLIKSVHEKVFRFFPEYSLTDSNEVARAITIEDLLTMTAPFKYKAEPYEAFLMSANWLESALSYLGGTARTHTFFYSPMISTHILSGILERAIGQPLLNFAQKNLFDPMAITVDTPIILKSKEDHLALMNGQPRRGWVCDSQGILAGGWGLFLNSNDLMKIGKLILNHGMWKGEQLVSAQWLHRMTQVHSQWEAIGLSYGYLWWVIDPSKGVYAAVGDGGNTLYVNEEKNLVISLLAPFKPNVTHSIEWIENQVIPMIDPLLQ